VAELKLARSARTTRRVAELPSSVPSFAYEIVSWAAATFNMQLVLCLLRDRPVLSSADQSKHLSRFRRRAINCPCTRIAAGRPPILQTLEPHVGFTAIVLALVCLLSQPSESASRALIGAVRTLVQQMVPFRNAWFTIFLSDMAQLD